ncbi:hypothetical protein JCM25156A_00430 [Komagataeibacter kakiaceti JCM 25156]
MRACPGLSAAQGPALVFTTPAILSLKWRQPPHHPAPPHENRTAPDEQSGKDHLAHPLAPAVTVLEEGVFHPVRVRMTGLP